MCFRPLVLAFSAFAFLLLNLGLGHAVECTVCERKLADCRSPAQAKFVSCMNSEKSQCSTKCANDCRNQAETQRCTLNCVKTCQTSAGCQGTFTTATNSCNNDYQSCRKDCTR